MIKKINSILLGFVVFCLLCFPNITYAIRTEYVNTVKIAWQGFWIFGLSALLLSIIVRFLTKNQNKAFLMWSVVLIVIAAVFIIISVALANIIIFFPEILLL